MKIKGRDNRGRKETPMRTLWIEYISANLPTRGDMAPPNPKANPIIRLATMDRPFGARIWAIATPRGRVARTKAPAIMAPR